VARVGLTAEEKEKVKRGQKSEKDVLAPMLVII
jgi:hypothetical protein